MAKKKKNTATIEITLTLRGEPTAVVHALANGLPIEALDEIRGGMVAEMEKREKLRKRSGARDSGRRRVVIRGKGRK